MSLIFMDGFDDGLSVYKWTSLSNVGVGGTGRTGSALPINGGDVRQAINVVAAADKHATFILGFAFKVAAAANGEFLRLLGDNNTTIHLAFEITNTNAIRVRRGSGGTELGISDPGVFVPNAFYFFEVKATLSDTVGVVVFKINGVTVLNLTGQDTKNGGTATVFDTWNFNSIFGPAYTFDDVYVCNGAGSVNNDFLGDCSVVTLYPSGDGNYSQWVGSDGNSVNNSLLVDEAGTPNTTDYVESGTATTKDSYVFGDLPGTAVTVLGVAIRSYAAKSDAGAQLFRHFARVGGTDYPAAVDKGPSVTPSYIGFSDMFEQSPATSSLWTVAEVNGAEFGVEAR